MLGVGGPIKKHKESTMAIAKASQRADNGVRRIKAGSVGAPAAHYPLSVRPAAQMVLGLGHQATECRIVRYRGGAAAHVVVGCRPRTKIDSAGILCDF